MSSPTDTDRHKNSTRQSEAQHPHDCLLKCDNVSQGNVNLKQLPKSQFLDRGSAPAVTSKVYSPIRDWQTRLLALHPGQPNDVLRGTLVTVDLIQHEGVVIHDTQEKIYYDALSYTWGVPDYSHWIHGLSLAISSNLCQALQQTPKA